MPIKDDHVCIDIRRSHLLKDALKQCWKSEFDPENALLVSITFLVLMLHLWERVSLI